MMSRGVPNRGNKNWGNKSTGGEPPTVWMDAEVSCKSMQRAYMPSLPFAAGERC
jgi:hypothetical protein